MIGQEIGLRWLIPLALAILEADPLAEGDFYPGDLLASVLRAPATFWENDSESRVRLELIVSRLGDPPKELSDVVASFRISAV